MKSISFVEWAITGACNMSCSHCMYKGQERMERTSGQLDSIADMLIAEGVSGVTLTGGEPLLSENWERISRHLSGGGVSVQLITNGLLLNETTAHALKVAGVAFVWLSLDGLEATHDRIRCQPGSFAKVMAASRHLHAVGLPFGYMTTLLARNFMELPAMAQLARDRGATAQQVWLGMPTSAEGLFISPQQMSEVHPIICKAAERFPRLYIGDNIGYGPQWDALRHPVWEGGTPTTAFRGCVAGERLAGITADGVVKPCLARRTEDPQNNLEWRSLHDALSPLPTPRLAAACTEICQSADKCYGGCPAMMESMRAVTTPLPCCQSTIPTRSRWTKVLSFSSLALLAACSRGGTKEGRGADAQPSTPSPALPQAAMVHGRHSSTPPPLPMDKAQAHTKRTMAPAPRVRSGNSIENNNKNNPLRTLPSCCLSHMLVPGCKCGYPAPQNPSKPTP